jgi:opacity protein-like surface antigen
MQSWRLVVNCVVVCAAVALSAGTASGEWFADLFVGGTFTENSDPVATTSVGGVSTKITTFDIHHDDSIVFGGRFGYWIDPLPYLGVGLDVSHFDADVSRQSRTVVFNPDLFGGSGSRVPANPAEIGITVISLDLMLRWPLLASPAFPRGQLQPYLAAGPALFIARVEDQGNLGTGTQSDTDTAIGLKVAGGVTWLFTKNIGVFAEYRFTRFDPESKFRSVDPFTGAPGTTTINSTLSTHHVVAGVTFRY